MSDHEIRQVSHLDTAPYHTAIVAVFRMVLKRVIGLKQAFSGVCGDLRCYENGQYAKPVAALDVTAWRPARATD